MTCRCTELLAELHSDRSYIAILAWPGMPVEAHWGFDSRSCHGELHEEGRTIEEALERLVARVREETAGSYEAPVDAIADPSGAQPGATERDGTAQHDAGASSDDGGDTRPKL